MKTPFIYFGVVATKWYHNEIVYTLILTLCAGINLNLKMQDLDIHSVIDTLVLRIFFGG